MAVEATNVIGDRDMLKILVVDDHAIVRRGLILILEGGLGIPASCDEACNSREAELRVAKGEYDLVVLDISMPGVSGLDLLKKLHKSQPNLPIVVLSMLPEDQYAVRAITLGAAAYLTKESVADELIRAAQKVLSGGQYISTSVVDLIAEEVGPAWQTGGLPHEKLSDREFEILLMIGQGRSTEQIATTLFVSGKTVSTHRSKILKKFRMTNNFELIKYVLKNNLIA